MPFQSPDSRLRPPLDASTLERIKRMPSVIFHHKYLEAKENTNWLRPTSAPSDGHRSIRPEPAKSNTVPSHVSSCKPLNNSKNHQCGRRLRTSSSSKSIECLGPSGPKFTTLPLLSTNNRVSHPRDSAPKKLTSCHQPSPKQRWPQETHVKEKSANEANRCWLKFS